MLIEDGTGKGFSAQVGSDNRLHTFSLIEYPIEAFSHTGDVYTIPTNFISLTNIATYSGMIYINESSAVDIIHIEGIRTSSTQPCLWQLWRNSTAGTLISGGTAAVPVNMNFSSGKTVTAACKIGTAGAGLTVTDGALLAQWMTAAYDPQERQFSGSLILGAGNSLALTCMPTVNPTVVGSTITMWEESLTAR